MSHSEQPSIQVTPPPQPPPYPWYPPVYAVEEEVNLLDYFRIIKRHLGKIILITLLATGLAAVASVKLTKKYQSQASLMALSQSGGGGGLAAIASQVGSMPGMSSLAGLAGLGGNQKSGQIISILKSRTLIEKVIHQFDLMKVMYAGQWDAQNKKWLPNLFGKTPLLEDAVEKFRKKILKVEEDKKTNLIKVQVELKDSVLASQVVNQMLIELQEFISKNQLTVAKRNRIFIEEQLEKNKVELLESGKKMNQFYANNRISSVQPQLDVQVGKVEPRADPLADLQNSVQQLNSQKEDLKNKMASEEKSITVTGVPSQVYLQYLGLQRELLGRVNALLTQQYELAKIEESKEDLSFQVIDKAIPQERESWPKKSILIPIGFLGGLFFSIFLAFFIDYLSKLKQKKPA